MMSPSAGSLATVEPLSSPPFCHVGKSLPHSVTLPDAVKYLKGAKTFAIERVRARAAFRAGESENSNLVRALVVVQYRLPRARARERAHVRPRQHELVAEEVVFVAGRLRAHVRALPHVRVDTYPYTMKLWCVL